MGYQGGSYTPTNHAYIFPSEEEFGADSPGGLVIAQIAEAALNIGDVTFLSAAHNVNKSNTPANYQKFAGVVVGGYMTNYEVLQDDMDIGIQAAAAGQLVLLGYFGKFKVVSDAAIAALGLLTQGATTAGRVDDSASATQGQIIGVALEAAGGAAVNILALINHR